MIYIDDYSVIYANSRYLYYRVNGSRVKCVKLTPKVLKCPKSVDYILRRDRCVVLYKNGEKLIFLRNFTICKINLQKMTLSTITRLQDTRVVFSSGVVNLGDTIVFFDYHSQGLKKGIFAHISWDAGENWEQRLILEPNVTQRVISAHLINTTGDIVFSTGDDADYCHLGLFNMFDQSLQLLKSGSEDLRFMKVFIHDSSQLSWISNNRQDGPSLIHYDITSNLLESKMLSPSQSFNFWHVVKLADQYHLGETREPVKFMAYDNNLKVSVLTETILEESRSFRINELLRFLRFPSIEVSEQSSTLLYEIKGTHEDGCYMFDNGELSFFNLLSFDLMRSEDDAIRSWSIDTLGNLWLWKNFTSTQNIKRFLGVFSPGDYRLMNIKYRLIDLLR